MTTTRVNFYKLNKAAADTLASIGKLVCSVDAKLRALVELRCSQINGCAYCVDMHATQARAHGETQQRLDCLAAWWECDFFTSAEEAAFRWAEALTDISHTHAPDDVYHALAEHYSEQQIADLTLIVSVINAWNRISIAHRTHPAKR